MAHFIPCITKMLVNSHNVCLTVCEGVPEIFHRCCEKCEIYEGNQQLKVGETTEENYQPAVCSMQHGLTEPNSCSGDNDIRDEECVHCVFYANNEEKYHDV